MDTSASSAPASSSQPSATNPAGPPSSASSTPSSPPPPPPPPSSSSAASSNTSTTASTSATSASTSTTPTSSNAPTTNTTPPSTVAPPQTSTNIRTSTDAAGGVVTVTSLVTTQPSPTRSVAPALGSNGAGGGSKSFFQNTGAVAGTFAVVGVVVIALLITLITALLRRRRNRKLDREIAEAEAEAAMAPAPVFLDDENDVYGPGAGGGYSDVSSHGTYGQPAMSIGHSGLGGQEAYGMRELGPGPGEIYDPSNSAYGTGAAAGAAGIGVARARSTRDGGYAAGLQDGAAPYAAFSLPRQESYNTQGGPQYANMPVPPATAFRGPGSPEFDLLEAAGMGTGAMGAGMAAGRGRNASGHHSPPGDLTRNTSQGAHSSGAGSGEDGWHATRSQSHSNTSSSPQQESYAAHYQPGFNYQSQPPATHHDADDNADAYGGFIADNQHHQGGSGATGRSASPPGLPNPFSSGGSRGHEYHDGDDDSSDEEEAPSRRVLKVANE